MEQVIKINKGSILVYRVFDLGEEISLVQVEKLIKDMNSRRLSLARNPRKALVIREAPLALELGEFDLTINGNVLKIPVAGKIWDYGALSLCYQIPIPAGATWNELVDLAVMVDSHLEIDEDAKQRSKNFSNTISSAIKLKSSWDVFEDYTIYFLEAIEGIEKDDMYSLTSKVNIPALIYAENKEVLSDISKKILLDSTHQYSKNDLAVIDWNSALVVEPQGVRDVPDVIEFSFTHLLEMRYYDDLLDEKLQTLYDSIEVKRNQTMVERWKGILNDMYSKLAEDASQKYIEVSEFVDRVDNSLKTVGDFYLAVIFRSASSRFRFDDWRKSIQNKMDNLAQISELLGGEVNSRRSHYMEILVIILILGEIITAVLPWIVNGKGN
jgi:hypothetical protein